MRAVRFGFVVLAACSGPAPLTATSPGGLLVTLDTLELESVPLPTRAACAVRFAGVKASDECVTDLVAAEACRHDKKSGTNMIPRGLALCLAEGVVPELAGRFSMELLWRDPELTRPFWWGRAEGVVPGSSGSCGGGCRKARVVTMEFGALTGQLDWGADQSAISWPAVPCGGLPGTLPGSIDVPVGGDHLTMLRVDTETYQVSAGGAHAITQVVDGRFSVELAPIVVLGRIGDCQAGGVVRRSDGTTDIWHVTW